jgi:RNA polymerase sigma-70 factor (ECF subfamily)
LTVLLDRVRETRTPRNFPLPLRVQYFDNVTHDDAPLIQATLRGDSHAYGKLVQKYQDRLLTALVHVCSSRHEAEDALQDAFVQAYLKLASFAGGSAFYTWLYRIAFNTAISRRRRRRDESSVEQNRELTGDEPQDDGEGVDENLLRQERAVQVQKALAKLSDEHRSILVLREVEGCDYDHIADILDLPVGTVRSRLHRARLHLKEELSAILQAEGSGE